MMVVGVVVEGGDVLPDTLGNPRTVTVNTPMTLSVGLVPCGLGWDQAVSQDTDNTVSVVFFKDLEEDNVPLNVEPLIYALE